MSLLATFHFESFYYFASSAYKVSNETRYKKNEFSVTLNITTISMRIPQNASFVICLSKIETENAHPNIFRTKDFIRWNLSQSVLKDIPFIQSETFEPSVN